MKMKKNMKSFIVNLSLASLAISSASLVGCADYLNVDEYFADTFMADSIFASSVNIQRYYNGAVSLLPKEARLWYYGSTPGLTGSDEAVSCGNWSGGFLEIQFSGTSLTIDNITASSMAGWDWDFNVWDNCYRIIRKCNTLLTNIDAVPDMNSFEKSEFRSEVRFLRAYAYYWILRNQGPMILLGDEILNSNEAPAYYERARGTFDECVDYICTEFEAAAQNLPRTRPVDMITAPTAGAALALSARIRLAAASPLFNGGFAARRFFGNFIRSTDKVPYVSQTYDERKWAVAAAAAKRVMDLKLYDLYTVEADQYTAALPSNVPSADYPNGAGGIDPYRSYSEQFTGEAVAATNPELIWGTSENILDHLGYIFPLRFGGSSCVSVPQRMVDYFYMADGRDISNASAECPYLNRPYDKECITQEDKILSRYYTLKAGTFAAYANREPRFYANIGFSGRLWTMSSTIETGKHDVVVGYYMGANCGPNVSTNNVYNITGYTGCKYVHPRDACTGNNARTISKTFPIIRYAEVLLSYAEALNHLTQEWDIDGIKVSRDKDEIRRAFNRVRFRAGLPGVTDEELASEEAFEAVVERERCIELFHEGRRYYDIRRWGIVEQLESEPLQGLNVNQAEWAGFYQPTIIQYSTIRERVFKPKMVLLPIHLNELRKNPLLDQNPGWEK